MPELDGLQVLELVRQYTNAPVIMLTADKEADSVKKALVLGAYDYVVKPFSIKDLVARVQAKLRHAGLGVP